MSSYAVTLLPGDGTGPEIAEATRRVIDATGVKIDWDVAECGLPVIQDTGKIPDEVFASLRRNGVGLKGPMTTPIGKGIRSINVALRQELGLFACVRPCKVYPGVKSRYQPGEVDLVLVRENTEDLYAGVEFKAGDLATIELIKGINAASSGKKIGGDFATTGISIKPISEAATRRICNFAFKYAGDNGRKSVTSVCKANIMKFTDGLWYDVTRAVATAYYARFEDPKLTVGVVADRELLGSVADLSQVIYNERLVDAICMQLVQTPGSFDVIVTENLYGDILSDLCAGLVGGLGVAPGANFGDDCALFEAVHGSAPKYAGQNKVNPTALILSGMLMLRHLGEADAADKLERAVAEVIRRGTQVTYDLKADRNDPTAVGTSEMADAIIAEMQKAG